MRITKVIVLQRTLSFVISVNETIHFEQGSFKITQVCLHWGTLDCVA